jgi:hypothetical protein
LFADSWKYIETEFLPWLQEHNIAVVDDRYSFPDASSYYDNYHLGPEANQALAKKFGAQVDEIVVNSKRESGS